MSDEENYEREESEIPNIRKTYIVTNELTTPLPSDFVWSMNKKYIEIQNCKLYDFVNKVYQEDLTMHCNLIHERDYLDKTVGLVNHIHTQYKRYEVKGNEEELQIWFTKEMPPASKINDPYIFVDGSRKYPKFEEYNYRNTPNLTDLFYLMYVMREFFPSTIIDDYKKSKLTKKVKQELDSYQSMFQFGPIEYLSDVMPLFEDETFYTNDFLLNKILDIYNVCTKLIEENNPNSILPGKLVYYFLHGFKTTLEYDYEKYFGILPNPPSLGIGLTGYVYWEMTDYEDVLDNFALAGWHFSSTKWLDYCKVSLFLYMVEYIQREYGLKWDIALMDEFEQYWLMIEHFINVPLPSQHADYLIDLADRVVALKDFTKASIQPILDYFSVDLSYEPPFKDAVTPDSLSYLYCELIGIIFLGYREKKLQWVEYSKTKIKTGYSVIEIARDPLYPDWFLQRLVDYVVLNPFPEEHYTLNPATSVYEPNYCFLAEFMLIF